MIESISYSDADRLRTQDAELKRQAKMFKTSNILSSLLQDYDSRLRPKFGEEPVDVDVTLHVDSLGPISETDMSFRVDLAFRQYWMDKRLDFSGRSNESITLSHEFLHKIWLPDTYFPGEFSFYSIETQYIFCRSIYSKSNANTTIKFLFMWRHFTS